jgi:ISXO2 transposase-like protein
LVIELVPLRHALRSESVDPKRNESEPIPNGNPECRLDLVERGGQARVTHVADVSARTLREAIAKHAHKCSTMNTDDALAYYHMSKEFAAHGVVNHSADEYVSKDGTVHIQSAEAFFAILKRGVMGSFHSISEQHLQRYLDEFAFRWNNRSSLGVEDTTESLEPRSRCRNAGFTSGLLRSSRSLLLVFYSTAHVRSSGHRPCRRRMAFNCPVGNSPRR